MRYILFTTHFCVSTPKASLYRSLFIIFNIVMTAVFNSKFFKADARANNATGAGSTYTATFGACTLCDVFLPPATATVANTLTHSQNILIPIVGPISVDGNQTLAPGSIYCTQGGAAPTVHVKNTSDQNTVNFLHLSCSSRHCMATGNTVISDFPLTTKNCLVAAEGFPAIKIGLYDGRRKDILRLQQPGGSLFTYIINGSFEVDGRLMEYRDGLHQWEIDEIDFEALSEAAIILFIECSTLK